MSAGSGQVRRGSAPGSVATDPDVVVVGGGAAGLAAAAAGRASGGRVVLVSEGPPGGDCTWHGCVPTKSVLEAAAAGLGAQEAFAHARAVVARVARTESGTALREAGVEVVRQRARLRPGARVLLADGTVLAPAAGVVLATGSRPRGPERSGLDLPADVVVATTDGWLDAVEEHGHRARSGRGGPLLVVGGGAGGVELAQALARTGAARPHEVVLLERGDSLLAALPGAGAVVAASLAADGVRVVTGATADRVRAEAAPGSLVLLSAGRDPVVDGVEDEAVLRGPAGVLVDAAMRTRADRVCAAGDVTGLRPSTHVAVATGRVAAATLLGVPAAFDTRWVPQVVYTDPEVAAVGVVGPGTGRADGGKTGEETTDEDATGGDATGEVTRSVRVPLSRNDRALTATLPATLPATTPATRPAGRGRTRGGFAQVWVRGRTDPAAPDGPLAGGGRLTGVLLVGPHAGELVGEAALVGRLGLDVEQWGGGRVGLGTLSAHHAYPTWSWLWEPVMDRLLGR